MRDKTKNSDVSLNLTTTDLCNIYSVLNHKTSDRSKHIRWYLYIEITILTLLIYVISFLTGSSFKLFPLLLLIVSIFFIIVNLFIINSFFNSLIRDYISLYKVEFLLGLTKELPELKIFKPNDTIIDKKYINLFESNENIISKIKRRNGEYIISLIWHVFLIAVLVIILIYNIYG